MQQVLSCLLLVSMLCETRETRLASGPTFRGRIYTSTCTKSLPANQKFANWARFG